MLSWRKDFRWSWRGVFYKETETSILFSPSLAYDIYRWGVYTVIEKSRNLFRRKHTKIACFPKPIRPWYMLWAILTRSDIRISGPGKVEDADFAIYFYDSTLTSPPAPPQTRKDLNFDCKDISKSTVSNIFEEVFGYDLTVNPTTYSGKMVVKSEKNGAHDGRIVQGPTKLDENLVYQRIINNETDDDHVRDLRCPMLFGKPIITFIKERPVGERFKNSNSRCSLADPNDLFSEDELAKISRFCQKMKLDFGGIDILRDNDSGRIYIVDVNKTDMGPPMALSLKEKLKSVDIMARAFNAAFPPTKEG